MSQKRLSLYKNDRPTFLSRMLLFKESDFYFIILELRDPCSNPPHFTNEATATEKLSILPISTSYISIGNKES